MVYVDDIILTKNNTSTIRNFISRLNKEISIFHLDIWITFLV